MSNKVKPMTSIQPEPKTVEEIKVDTIKIVLWMAYSYVMIDKMKETIFYKSSIKQRINLLEKELDLVGSYSEVKHLYKVITNDEFSNQFNDNLDTHEQFFEALTSLKPHAMEVYMRSFI